MSKKLTLILIILVAAFLCQIIVAMADDQPAAAKQETPKTGVVQQAPATKVEAPKVAPVATPAIPPKVATPKVPVTTIATPSKSQAPENESAKHLAMLKERLNLTDAQVSQIQTIFEESKKQALTEKEKNSGISDQALKDRMDARKATDEKIMSVLNDDQKKEYSKIQQEEKKQTIRRHHRSDQNDQGKSSSPGDNNQKPGR
jgi:hypothetical protein